MGGRVDATNVMKKSIPVFAHISLDHANILGDTVGKIAREKGGIIKENSNVFSYPQDQKAKEELQKICREKNSIFNEFKENEIEILSSDEFGSKFNFRDYKNVEISLIGEHQIYNASLALMVLDSLKEKYNLNDEKIKLGIKKAKNLGRIECLSKNPLIVIDGSHNLDSIEKLVENIKKFKYNKLILGFSLLKDKDHLNILKKVENIADKIVLTEIDNERFTDVESLYSEFEKISDKEVFAIKNRGEAVKKTFEIAEKGDLILWCGSLYLIKDIRKIILDEIN